MDASCEDKVSEGVELCPFLRNIGVSTSFVFSKLKLPTPAPVTPWLLLSYLTSSFFFFLCTICIGDGVLCKLMQFI